MNINPDSHTLDEMKPSVKTNRRRHLFKEISGSLNMCCSNRKPRSGSRGFEALHLKPQNSTTFLKKEKKKQIRSGAEPSRSCQSFKAWPTFLPDVSTIHTHPPVEWSRKLVVHKGIHYISASEQLSQTKGSGLRACMPIGQRPDAARGV